MLRDASHQQVIQKFSFIESLNLSRGIDQADQKILDQIQSEQVASTQQQAENTASKKTDLAATAPVNQGEKACAIVASSETASTINAHWYESDSNSYGLNVAEIIKYSASENLTDNDNLSSSNHNYLGKILFALASSYCLFSLWWLFGHQGGKLLTMVTGGKRINLSKSDAEFIDYVERSLDSIDRLAESSKSNSDQVVYVPVYTPNSTTPSIPQVSNDNLPLTALPSNDAPKIPEPIAATEAIKIPAPPPLPAPTPLAETSPPQATEKVAMATAEPSVQHTLIGILELGENKSAALVKVKGQTRRVWLGEQINSSGWILESVTNQTAKISYQGQVRSISVGETF